MGQPQSPEESQILGQYGEVCTRNKHTNRFMELLFEFDMVSLHGRTEPDGDLVYSFYSGADHSRRSIPDGIFVSRTMHTKITHAKILPISLTGKEWHN